MKDIRYDKISTYFKLNKKSFILATLTGVIFNGLMAIPNMIAIFALNGVVVKETKNFFERHKNGEISDW